jgi:ligand-binding SRPBCC domain-containing protein
MSVHWLEREQLVPRPVDEVFDFFARAHNLEQITPPWLRFELLTPAPIAMATGTRIDYRLRVHGVPLRWTSRIEEWESNRAFVDRQERGPYRDWRHRHDFVARGETTVVRDRVRYSLPWGSLGTVAHAAVVRRDLERIFDYRRDAVRALLGDP